MVSELDLVLVIGFTGVFALLVFVIYWALEIRHALFVRLFRNQALGVALVALAVILITLGNFPQTGGLGGFVIIYFGILLIFYWIDISLRAARRSDPLLRDILAWSKVRKVLWPLNIAIVAFLAAWIVLIPRELILFLAPPGIVFITGALYLPLAAKRSRDPILRRHFIWFGLFFIVYSVSTLFGLGNFPSNITSDIILIAGLLVSGYFLYRSARSLVPLNRMPLEGTNPKDPSDYGSNIPKVVQ